MERVAKVQNQFYKTELPNILRESFETGTLCDLTLVVGNGEVFKTYHAHQAVVFSTMENIAMYMDPDTKEDPTIYLFPHDPDVFGLILQYVYTGRITLSSDEINNFLQELHYFGMNHCENSS